MKEQPKRPEEKGSDQVRKSRIYGVEVRKNISPLKEAFLLRWLSALNLDEKRAREKRGQYRSNDAITIDDLPLLFADGNFLVDVVEHLTGQPLHQISRGARAPRAQIRNTDTALAEIWKHGPVSYFMSSAEQLVMMPPNEPGEPPRQIHKLRALALLNELFEVICARNARANFNHAFHFLKDVSSNYDVAFPDELEQAFASEASSAAAERALLNDYAPGFWALFGTGSPILCALHFFQDTLFAGLNSSLIQTQDIALHPIDGDEATHTFTSALQGMVDALLPVFFNVNEWRRFSGIDAAVNPPSQQQALQLAQDQLTVFDFLVLQITLLVQELESFPKQPPSQTDVTWRDSEREPRPFLTAMRLPEELRKPRQTEQQEQPRQQQQTPAQQTRPQQRPRQKQPTPQQQRPQTQPQVQLQPQPERKEEPKRPRKVSLADLPDDEKSLYSLGQEQPFVFVAGQRMLPVNVRIDSMEIRDMRAYAAPGARIVISAVGTGQVLFNIPVTMIKSIKCTGRSVRLFSHEQRFSSIDNSLQTENIILQEREEGLVAWYGSSISLALRRVYDDMP